MNKVVIVDDEKAGRQMITEYLDVFSDWVVVGEANNGVDAVKIINEFKPDLIFLDIEMPGMNGFEVLSKMEEIPQIIFSTAYDQYAIQAFEVHAIDYLLKPYTKDRFLKAIEKVVRKDQLIQPLIEEVIMSQKSYPDRILVEFGKKLITIAVTDIIQIQANGNYSKLILENNQYLSNYGISILEQKLDPSLFIRVHRSTIINVAWIQSLEKYINTYHVLLKNQETIKVSRGYKSRFKDLMY